MNGAHIYRQAIKRTFADLYGLSPGTVDVSWTTGKTIVVQCAGKTFLHPILSDPDDDAPEFTCLEEDPVIVNLTDDERRRPRTHRLTGVPIKAPHPSTKWKQRYLAFLAPSDIEGTK